MPPVIRYTIHKPVWKTESIGIATKRLVDGAIMEVDIDYKDASGNLLYPYKYRMPCSKIAVPYSGNNSSN